MFSEKDAEVAVLILSFLLKSPTGPTAVTSAMMAAGASHPRGSLQNYVVVV